MRESLATAYVTTISNNTGWEIIEVSSLARLGRRHGVEKTTLKLSITFILHHKKGCWFYNHCFDVEGSSSPVPLATKNCAIVSSPSAVPVLVVSSLEYPLNWCPHPHQEVA